MNSANVRVPPRQKRAISGVLLLDKPTSITSQTAVLKAKRLCGAAKAGHTGTLDPMAGGLLPICFGEATKFSHLLLDADKGYAATIKLGMRTSTGDMEGAVIATALVHVDRTMVENVLHRFVGDILQTPPMYSAIKHAGKPLYKYARAGLDIARPPRSVRISELHMESLAGDELRIRVKCSKGTYVRVLAEDIGDELGCGACLSALRRTAVGFFTVDRAVTLTTLADLSPAERLARLLPVDSLVATLPRLDLRAADIRRLMSGLAVEGANTAASGLVRIYGPGEEYVGVATVEAPGGTIVPRRLMATSMPTAK